MHDYEIIILNNQGFCYGVKQAIRKVEMLIEKQNAPKPYYLLGSLVHNHHVNTVFEQNGFILLNHNSRLTMLNNLTSGTIIISAHGVSDKVLMKAKAQGLTIIDTTCPHVKKAYQQIKDAIVAGYDVFFIGKKNHPEVESVKALGKRLHVLYQLEDINKITTTNEKTKLAIQTTLTKDVYDEFYHHLKVLYPFIIPLKQVCQLTTNRQSELHQVLSKEHTNPHVLFLVIGDKTSSNTIELLNIIKSYNAAGLLISDVTDLEKIQLNNVKKIYISSGTSAPLTLVKTIVDKLKSFDLNTT